MNNYFIWGTVEGKRSSHIYPVGEIRGGWKRPLCYKTGWWPTDFTPVDNYRHCKECSKILDKIDDKIIVYLKEALNE